MSDLSAGAQSTTPSEAGSRPRYLMVADYFWPAKVFGGPAYSNLNLCRGLAALGREVRVVTSDANRGEPLGVPVGRWVGSFPGIRVVYHRVNNFGTRFHLISARMLLDLWREIGRADVVLVQGLYNLATPFAMLFGWLHGKTVVVTPHGGLSKELIALRRPRAKGLWLRCLAGPLANKVLWHATAEQEKAEILQQFPKARVLVIPNGVDLDEYAEASADTGGEMRRRFGLAENTGPVVVCLGRIHRKKGLDVLICAFETLLTEFPDAHLLIAGQDDGGELARLRSLVSERRLAERVSFPGHLEGESKRLFLAGADLFVLPSLNENFGNVYAEALAAGTPVVASKASA